MECKLKISADATACTNAAEESSCNQNVMKSNILLLIKTAYD